MKTHQRLGENAEVQEGAIVGFIYRADCQPAVIGDHSIIRTGTIIYGDVSIGDHFQTGHNAVVRERSIFGRFCLVGTGTVVDGNVKVADFVKVESNCYICTHVTIGTRVFIGPNVILTNDRYPLKNRDAYKPVGPIIEDFVTIGAGSVILPGVRLGEGSFVSAGSVVTKDVPPMHLAQGNPARISEIPEHLKERNIALNWRNVIDE